MLFLSGNLFDINIIYNFDDYVNHVSSECFGKPANWGWSQPRASISVEIGVRQQQSLPCDHN
jgi:hypothetical protein